MNNRVFCETIKQTVTAAICAMRLSNLKEYIECAECRLAVLVKKEGAINHAPTVRTNKPAEVEIMTEETKKYYKHSKCKREGCDKFAVKDGECTKHFNETNGIVKKHGRQPGTKVAQRPRGPEAQRPRGPEALPPIKGGMKDGDIVAKLKDRKLEIETELAAIDNALELIERYGGK